MGRRVSRDRQGEQAVRALLPGAQDCTRGRVGPVHGSAQGAPPGHFKNYWLQKPCKRDSTLLKEQVFQGIGGPGGGWSES